ncbi:MULTISPECIES: phenylacetic acid degradation operon negative regulatory protein PaaX [Shouchella]|uniref:Phenylacetic acid degradation operon negative regulatory protein PaaX n=2 Tax=Shouchella TaxID=2893057 RepID=A0ABY7W0Z7_9BACI|nr:MULTISPECIES: phenylacetic acid degradation operon negative regulatory protein PaaX [Shouchella]MED4128524.1 phenylacetic acid degradation operon negative regulatory protein PaaX [Shouchella miscanthi]WDF02358.1 phenylacetic acid degradation operon negative regulatory protein PaaX [Shouchella hunanensis]
MGANTQSMIFTVFGDYIRHYGSKVWIGSLIQLLKEFGHNEQAVRVAVSRMVKQGWLLSERRGAKSYYSLTSRGIDRMDEAGHRIFKFEDHTWDGKWRMLLYKIPEEQRQLRDELRKELLWSGFGSFSASCWISPNPLEERVQTMIDKYDIREYVDFFEAVYKSEENENLVAKSWPLSEIEEKYQTFIEQYLPSYLEHRQAMQEQRLTDADCFVVRTNLVHEYRKFLFIDPGLPRELLPASWSGREAKQLFGQYYRLLAKPASRFFESIFEVDNDLTSKESSYDASSHPFIAKE